MLIQTHIKADKMSSTQCVGRTAALSEQMEGHMTLGAGNAETFQTVLTEMSYLSINNLMNREEKSNQRKNLYKQIQKIQIPAKCMLTCHIDLWMLVPPALPAPKTSPFQLSVLVFPAFSWHYIQLTLGRRNSNPQWGQKISGLHSIIM